MTPETELYQRVMQGWKFEFLRGDGYWKARAQNAGVAPPSDLLFGEGRTRESALESVLWLIERKTGKLQ